MSAAGIPRGALRSALVASLAIALVAGTATSADGYYLLNQGYYVLKKKKRSFRKPAAGVSSLKRSNPEREGFVDAPKGGVLQLVVSIGTQRLTLFRDGVRVAQSPVSTGTASHPTPTGVFSVIEKDRWHRSNLYGNAPMYFMQRVTWSGVAMHEGVLPGYPASHGCIRLPRDFAARLWPTTKLGARVIIARTELAPVDFRHPALFAPARKPAPPMLASLDTTDGAKPARPMVLVKASTNGSDAVPGGAADLPAASPEPPRVAEAEARNAAVASGTATTVPDVVDPRPDYGDDAGTEPAPIAAAARAGEPALNVSAVPLPRRNPLLLLPVIAEPRVPLPKPNPQTLPHDAVDATGAIVPMPARNPLSSELRKAIESPEPVEPVRPARPVVVMDGVLEGLRARESQLAVQPASEAPAPAAAARSSDDPDKPQPDRFDPPKLEAARTRSADPPPKRSGQVAVFVSRKEKKIFVRQGFIPIFEMPITIQNPDQPLGTHVFTAVAFTDGGAGIRWNLITIPEGPSRSVEEQRTRTRAGKIRRKPPVQPLVESGPPSSAAEALNRIQIPKEAADRVSELLIPGSSLVVSDHGLGRETGRYTEFIVLTR